MPPEDRIEPTRILVVADDRPLRDVLRFAVAASGWRVELAENAQHGLSRLAATPPDAVVIDAGLPDGEAVGLCRRLRLAGNDVPVLMVGALVVAERIAALEAGADDALPRPFDLGELRARLRALLRRAGASGADRLVFGELRLDRERHGVWVGEAFVDLSRTELQLLELFMRQRRHGARPRHDLRPRVGLRLRPGRELAARVRRLSAPQARRGRRARR